MGHFEGIISEEKERLIEAIEFFENEISKFEKGSIVKRKISSKNYAYLHYKENEKVISKYIGKVDSEKVKQIEENIIRRKELQRKLKDAKIELNKINKLEKAL